MFIKNMATKAIPYIKKYISVFLVLLFVVTAFGTMSQTVDQLCDSDTGFLIATGKYIVENKEVPTINPFVIHENHQTIIQQWVFDVIIYLLHSTFGLAGLFVFTLICFTIILFLLWKLMSIYTNNPNIKTTLLTAFTYMFRYWVEPRPTIMTSIIILCAILIFENYRRGKHKWSIWFLPILSLIQVNTHSSFWPLLFVFLLPYLAPNVIEFVQSPGNTMRVWFKKWWKVLVILIPSLAIGFVNPNGLRGISYVFLSYGKIDGLHTAGELYPVSINSIHGIAYIVSVIAVLFYIYKKRLHVDISLIYMAIGTLILAASHMRNIWFLIFAVLPIMCILLNDNICWITTPNKNQKFKSAILMSIAWIVIITTMTMCSTFRFIDCFKFPVQAANYLDQFENKDDLIIYTEHNGSYMQYRGYKTYIDGRPETFIPEINGQENILQEQYNARWIPSWSEKTIEKYKFTHMIVDIESPINGYLYDHKDYEMIIHGNEYVVYERVDFVGQSIYSHSTESN